jgi:opacity protein-like surface antigen
MKPLLLLSVLVCSLTATANAQNLVQNPNFATPTISGYQQIAAGTTGSSTSPIDDFTVDNGGTNSAMLTDPDGAVQVISGKTYDGSNGFPTYPTSNQIIDLGTNEGSATGPGGIKQTITTVPFDTYELTVVYSERTAVANTVATGVLTLGTSTETITATNAGSGSSAAPAFITSAPLLFKASSASTLVDVAMTDINGVSQEPLLIESISVTLVAVPEPSAVFLLFAGCGALALFSWRRRCSLLVS